MDCWQLDTEPHDDPLTLAERSTAGYDLLAREYYCPEKHPTCFNFTALHTLVLASLRPLLKPGELYLEVGCGRGQLDVIVAEGHVVLTDLSEGMLALARSRTQGRVPCQRMNAFDPHFPDRTFAGVAAFLADAYNHVSFFSAIRRVLKPCGFLAVTLPSHVWATALRSRLGFTLQETHFICGGKAEVAVPSITRPVSVQKELFSRLGYTVLLATTLSLELLAATEPSHHVRLAAAQLELEPRAMPLLDVYVVAAVGGC